jgi:hypothetical protein
MKLYHPDETVTSCSFEGQTIERGVDGTFDAPEGALELLNHGFTTKKPGSPAPAPAPVHDDEETGDDVIAKLAKPGVKKADIAAYAKQVYGLDLDPAVLRKDQLLAAIMEAMKPEADPRDTKIAELEVQLVAAEELAQQQAETIQHLEAQIEHLRANTEAPAKAEAAGDVKE